MKIDNSDATSVPQPNGQAGLDAPGVGAGSLHVLVVENHSDTRQGVRIFLGMLGHRVSCAENVADTLALASAEGGRFDVLLSDISLPDGDGWNLLAQLEARGIRPAHAIAMSGLSSTADCNRSRAAGFAIHLVKPFAPERLEEALEQVTGQKKEDVAVGVPVPEAGPGTDWRRRMHDGLCQHLVAASFWQEALVRRLEKMTSAGMGGEEPPGPSIEQAITEARQISRLLDDALTESRALMREV